MVKRESLHKLAFFEIFDYQSNFGFESKKSSLSMIIRVFLVSGNLSLHDSFNKLDFN